MHFKNPAYCPKKNRKTNLKGRKETMLDVMCSSKKNEHLCPAHTKSPCPHPRNLWRCYLTWQKTVQMSLTTLTWADNSGLSRCTQYNYVNHQKERIFPSWGQKNRSEDQSWNGEMLPCWKKGVTSQGMREAFKSWKSQENSLLSLLREMHLYQLFDFSPEKLVRDSAIQKHTLRYFSYF